MLDLLRTETPAWFSVDEVAQAAGVTSDDAWRVIGLGQAVVQGNLVSAADAVHLVRVLQGDATPSANRIPFNKIPGLRRKLTRSLASSGVLHAIGVLLLIVLPSLALLSSADSQELPKPKPQQVQLVYLMAPGPGGGGGGGGLVEPLPPRRPRSSPC